MRKGEVRLLIESFYLYISLKALTCCGFNLFCHKLCLLVKNESLFDFFVSFSVELLSEVRNDFDWMNILNF